MDNDFFDKLGETWPEIFLRKAVPELTGGLISAGYLRNLDSQTKGPERFRIGGRVVYRKVSFISWLRSRGKNA